MADEDMKDSESEDSQESNDFEEEYQGKGKITSKNKG
jgi:hypothetical protein